MAPEAIIGGYGMKYDEWSIGVIMYELITGKHPFATDPSMSNRDIMDAIRKGKFSIEGSEFENCSESCLELLNDLLQMDMEERVEANDALRYPFFNEIHDEKGKYPNQIEAEKAIETFYKFNAGNKMR